MTRSEREKAATTMERCARLLRSRKRDWRELFVWEFVDLVQSFGQSADEFLHDEAIGAKIIVDQLREKTSKN